jgi:hypothetical protein
MQTHEIAMAFYSRREYPVRVSKRTFDKMRYFFDLVGSLVKRDSIGAEFKNDEAVRQEAVLRSINEGGHGLQNYNGYHSISVRDQADRIVCTVLIQP